MQLNQPTQTTDIDPSAHNRKLADVLFLIGSYYTMAHDVHRANAFNNAATQIAKYPMAIMSGPQAGRELTRIGESTESVINEYLATGSVQRLKDLEVKFSEQKKVIDLFMSIHGIGPVTAMKYYNQGFRTLEDIWFKGNPTDAQKIGMMWREHINLRISREEMDLINERIGSVLNPYGIKWVIAGSYRRGEPSSGDVDVLVESRTDFNMDGLIQLLKPLLPATLAQGPKGYMGIIRIDEEHNGHRIDIKLMDPASYPFMVMHFTGSQRFNILMRQRAIDLGMRLNEYGLYYANGTPVGGVNSEDDIFRTLRVAYIPPVERTKTINALNFI